MDKPTKISDYKGGYIRTNEELRNGNTVFPKGTCFHVEGAGIKAYLRAMTCPLCGCSTLITLKGKGKFDRFEWLGYEMQPLGWTEGTAISSAVYVFLKQYEHLNTSEEQIKADIAECIRFQTNGRIDFTKQEE